ncbi:SMI1/KNR4 family protein [Phormidium sp. FACHB-592]|uniref:SMI1/KNR4 family protein n=1 Tax=Stenomitos frigidus AS-A4 TaxID=2933935 RepID=A0ABV0KUE1_9CYAN|nr:SMI1/KNR4 family protein [Phormidium sp. FACHB-592]MBD2075183.1 SMI1/KNR4 family protein [Phormidium sp. FACHB-592]
MYLNKAIELFPVFCHETQESYELKPSSEAQIEAYAAAIHLPLPKAYKEFLLWLGESAGGFIDSFILRGIYLRRNREDALELLAEQDCTELLPDDALVFAWFNQGQGFGFIRASEGDNPPVYFYVEGKGMLGQTHPNLEAFVIGYMNGMMSWNKR